jgi:hypothetical protein
LTRYYLDTTALIERWAGDPQARRAVIDSLGDDKHATSTHVRREWIRLVEGTTAGVLNVIEGGQEGLGAIFAQLSQGWGRDAGQRLRVLAMLAGQNRQVSAVELRLRARQVLRSRSKQMFGHHVDAVRDASECGLARNEVEAAGNGRLALVDRCKRTDAICRQDQFIDERQDDWRTASQGLVEHSGRSGDQKMRKLGLKIADNPLQGKGKNCYGLTGDISISMECAPGETLLTTDRSFEAIAKSRGLSVKRVPATSPP